jgi:hypothetical protein
MLPRTPQNRTDIEVADVDASFEAITGFRIPPIEAVRCKDAPSHQPSSSPTTSHHPVQAPKW